MQQKRSALSRSTNESTEYGREKHEHYSRQPRCFSLARAAARCGIFIPQSIESGEIGIPLEPVETAETEEAESLMLHLPGMRIPGGEACLAVLEFEIFRGEQEPGTSLVLAYLVVRQMLTHQLTRGQIKPDRYVGGPALRLHL
jgi:hypothetical protein